MVEKADFKIFLVNPACRDARIDQEDSMASPIGLFYIGALLKENRYNVELVNLAQEHDPLAYFSWILQNNRPDLIGFFVLNANRHNAVAAATAARQQCPDTCIVFGGPCATFMPEHLMGTNSAVDYIVNGEGEHTFLAIAGALLTNRRDQIPSIPGLVYRQQDTLIRTPGPEPIADLDQLPHPSKYFSFHHLSMSRGCPGRCTFCGSPKFWGSGRPRFHSAKWFADEIEALFNSGTRHFFISDDTFTLERERVISLCRILAEKKLDITWNAISRVDHIDEKMLWWMRKAGCIQISYGVESGSETIRRTLGKPVAHNDIIRAFKLTASLGILPRAYFIYGSPGENEQTIKETCELILKIKPLGAIFYILVLFPGTFLYENACRKGLVSSDVWNHDIEDIPWFEIDPGLDFDLVKQFGDTLRQTFFSNLHRFAADIELLDDKALYPCHADFLSRLAMTFSHGDYAGNPQVIDAGTTAETLYEKALLYHPDFRAFLGLGMLHMKTGRFKKAIEILETGLEHHPGQKDLLLCSALNHMNSGDFKKALAILEPLAHLPEARKYMTICNQKQGKAHP